eukprot:1397565-Pyramimonas_sp.AAC.1
MGARVPCFVLPSPRHIGPDGFRQAATVQRMTGAPAAARSGSRPCAWDSLEEGLGGAADSKQ